MIEYRPLSLSNPRTILRIQYRSSYYASIHPTSSDWLPSCCDWRYSKYFENNFIHTETKKEKTVRIYRDTLFDAKFIVVSMIRLSIVWKKCCFSNSKCLRNDFVRPLRLIYGSHPHDIKRPWLHARAMLCATPAAEIAYANALSL